MNDTFGNALIQALQTQRNNALDTAASLEAHLKTISEELSKLKLDLENPEPTPNKPILVVDNTTDDS